MHLIKMDSWAHQVIFCLSLEAYSEEGLHYHSGSS